MILERIIEKLFKSEINLISVLPDDIKKEIEILNHYKEILLYESIKIRSVFETNAFQIYTEIVPSSKKTGYSLRSISDIIHLELAKTISFPYPSSENILIEYEYNEEEYSAAIHQVLYNYLDTYKELYKYIKEISDNNIKVIPKSEITFDGNSIIKINDSSPELGFDIEVRNIKETIRKYSKEIIFYEDLNEDLRIGIKGDEIRLTLKNLRITLDGTKLLKVLRSDEEFKYIIKKMSVMSEIFKNSHIMLKDIDPITADKIIMIESYIEEVEGKSFKTFAKILQEGFVL